jgi:hypothetical protein
VASDASVRAKNEETARRWGQVWGQSAGVASSSEATALTRSTSRAAELERPRFRSSSEAYLSAPQDADPVPHFDRAVRAHPEHVARSRPADARCTCEQGNGGDGIRERDWPGSSRTKGRVRPLRRVQMLERPVLARMARLPGRRPGNR